MNDSTPPAVAPARSDANGYSFSVPLPDILFKWVTGQSMMSEEQVESRFQAAIFRQSPSYFNRYLSTSHFYNLFT